MKNCRIRTQSSFDRTSLAHTSVFAAWACSICILPNYYISHHNLSFQGSEPDFRSSQHHPSICTRRSIICRFRPKRPAIIGSSTSLCSRQDVGVGSPRVVKSVVLSLLGPLVISEERAVNFCKSGAPAASTTNTARAPRPPCWLTPNYRPFSRKKPTAAVPGIVTDCSLFVRSGTGELTTCQFEV